MAEPLFRYDDEPDTAEQFILRQCKAGLFNALHAAKVMDDKTIAERIEEIYRDVDMQCERVRRRG